MHLLINYLEACEQDFLSDRFMSRSRKCIHCKITFSAALISLKKKDQNAHRKKPSNPKVGFVTTKFMQRCIAK